MPATDAVQGQGFKLSVVPIVSPFSPITIGQLRTAKRSGSTTATVKITNTDSPSAYEEILPTIISPGDVDFSGVFGPDDASQVELQTLQDARSKNIWTIELPNTRGHWTFSAYVTNLAFDIDYSKEVSFSGKLTITGPVVYTAGS